MNDRADKYLNRNFGIALLDLDGNFIWLDSNSERFLENKKQKKFSQNFFSLLPPVSLMSLKKKFGLQSDASELFKGNKSVGSSITFSYLIYSKKNMNKYIK